MRQSGNRNDEQKAVGLPPHTPALTKESRGKVTSGRRDFGRAAARPRAYVVVTKIP
jgi:hypothetical protein